jgi:signal transduction histidine kinase/ActR/RegA family two-component response regulator
LKDIRADRGERVTDTARSPLRLLSLVVVIVLAGATVAVSFLTRSVIQDEQRRLLHERTAEASVLVSTLFEGAATALPVLGATTRPEAGATQQFTTAARPLLGEASAIGALQVVGARVTVIASVGSGPTVGSTVTGARATLAIRAVNAHGMVSAVLGQGAGRLLSLAVAVGPAEVLYQDSPLAISRVYLTDSGGPFSELDGALYASSRVDPSTLVLATTRRLPLTGTLDRQPVRVGAETWTIVTRSKGPLVGSLSADAPWTVLAAGLLGTVLAALLVETLLRRRAYALALVDERTLALRDALDEQARLKQGEREAREAAEAANHSKSEFLSRMSHELRTPLNAVLGFGQLLDLDELTESQQEAVDQILKGGRHLLDLINEVLDISRIESGTLPLSPEPVLVGELLRDTVELMRPLADHRHIQIVADPGVGADVHVLADRQRLKQILLNLIANAIKYNRDRGTVAVSCETVDSAELRITVADTGPGIRPEHLAQLFVPFERLGAERTDVEGTGVGLALSRRLAEAMGGTLDVVSVLGEGSRFSVQLSIVEGPLEHYERASGAPSGAIVPAPTESAEPKLRHKVLYIEDNLSNVRLMERVFERRSDVQLIPAMQGSLGVALAREHRPALILLDLHLSDVNGDEILRQLRNDPVTATTPVVIVSADATAGQVERLLAEGATSYLTKPLDVQDLLAVLDDAIGSSHTATSA